MVELDALTSRIYRGFEYRVTIARHTHAAFYRASFDKTIQLHDGSGRMRIRITLPAM
jgi:hypothetical protein